MTPLSITYRCLISKYIPQVKCKDISKYESLLVLHNDLTNEFNLMEKLKIFKPPRTILNEISKEVEAIFDSFSTEFELVTKLWLARREFALIQGNFHQIPTNWKDMWLYIQKLIKYYLLEFYALPYLWKNKIKGFFWSIFSKNV